MTKLTEQIANVIALTVCVAAPAIAIFMILAAIASIFLSGCSTNPQKADADYPTGQTAEALQKAAPVIDCAFTPRNLRFAECDE